MPNKFPVSLRRPRPTLHGHDAFFLSRDTQFGQCLLCGTQIKMTVCHTEKIQITTQQYDAVPFELALSDWWFDSWCRKLAISLFYKWLHLGSIKSLNIKVYFHTSYKMPFRPQRHKHQTFLSLNSGGLTDAIYLKIRRFAVFFKWKKNVPFVFPSEDCLGLLLSPSCFTYGGETEMFRRPGTQRHEVISCVAVKRLLRFSGRGSLPRICFACRGGMSAQAITSTEDTEVVISVWMDIFISIFHTKAPFRWVCSCSCCLTFNGDQFLKKKLSWNDKCFFFNHF